MTEPRIQRAVLLLQSGRAEEAITELTAALADDPGDAQAHALRALALSDLEDFPAALASAERAVGEAPEWGFAHATHARVLIAMEKPKEALRPAKAAVALDPDDEGHHATVAACYAGLARWKDALAAADRGLEIDPEDVQCTNLRALCLRQLGQVDEAESALLQSLRTDPENAWTFQNLGFAALRANRPDEAIEHFRESLRLDPTDQVSRQGLATALKAKVPLFRPILAWQMFSSSVSERFGLGLVLGLFVLVRVVEAFLPGHPVGGLLVIAYVAFVWMSWAADAAFDVLLLVRKDLRHLLERRERIASGGVILCLLIAFSLLVARFGFGFVGVEWLAIVAAFVAIPTAGWARLPNGKARTVGAAVAAAAWAAMLGAIGLALAMAMGDHECWADQVAVLAGLSLLVSVGSTWLMLGLGFVPESRGKRGTRRRPGRSRAER